MNSQTLVDNICLHKHNPYFKFYNLLSYKIHKNSIRILYLIISFYHSNNFVHIHSIDPILIALISDHLMIPIIIFNFNLYDSKEEMKPIYIEYIDYLYILGG